MVLSYPSPQKLTVSQAEYQRAWVEINLTTLADNVRQIKRFLKPHTQLMAVIKADGYGHGAVMTAKTALQAGADWFAVATSQEGITLREAGIQAPILVLGAINSLEEIKAVVQYQLQPTLCSPQQALIFSDTLQQLGHDLPVHLNIDTGMSRLGTAWTEALEFVQFVRQLPHLHLASCYSHFATADDPDPSFMELQHQRFKEAIAQWQQNHLIPPMLHIANSAATLTDSCYHYDLVRVGLAIYGLYPESHLRHKLALNPALAIKARITQVKTIPPQSSVSYGRRFVCDRPLQIAVVGIGYADGVPRALTNQMDVLLRGRRVPQIGAVTMDQLMLDVSAIPDLQAGEIATLIGRDGSEVITAEEWADKTNTISWEILCGFKQRLPRVY
ncbi:alanine racemase [Spirulina subsalsa]|uniref:alanine racemase n=1 Tax=Spirulina subsalsa TaxID=54311 RepID=UPI00031A3757|nr:alanine racemase [Spirulina subsalsa]